MGLAHFLYGDWDADDAATEAEEALLKACVAFERDGTGGSDEAQAITGGYRRVWVAAKTLADDEEDFDPEYFDTTEDAERMFRKVFLRAYTRVVRISYPKFKTDDDELAWWPEAIKYDSFWPRKLLAKIAATMGEIEAERGVCAARYYEQEKAKEAAESSGVT